MNITDAIGQHFSKGKASVLTNILSGKKWNQNTSFGIQSPLANNPKMPKEVKPKASFSLPNPFAPKPYKYTFPKKVEAQAPTVAKTPTITPAATPMVTPQTDSFEARTLPTFDKYKIPREVAYGIAAAENGKINKFNIGAVDSNPQNAVKYQDVESAATSAAKLLSGTAEDTFYGNGAKGKEAFRKAYMMKGDPIAMLKAIQDAGYAGDPKTWKARSIATGGAGKHFNSWSEFVRQTPAYKKWSKK